MLERNPLSQPLSTSGNSAYNLKPEYLDKTIHSIGEEIGRRNYDLKNPDTQYLRYK